MMDPDQEALPGIHKRLTALEKSHTYSNTLIENLAKDLLILNRTCGRIEQQFAGYETYLKDAIANDVFYKKIRDEVIAGVAKSAVWAVIVGLCIAIGYAIKAYIVHLANGNG